MATANMQAKVGRWRRFFGWFGRHKVTAVFCALVVGLALYLAGSWVVLQVQIHFERERFMATDQELRRLGDRLATSAATMGTKRECSYRGDTGFGPKWLGCESELDLTYDDISKAQTQRNADKIKTVLAGDGLTLRSSIPSDYFHEIASYDFVYRGISCSYISQFYDSTVPRYLRYGNVSKTGNAATISINCNGNAKTRYF